MQDTVSSWEIQNYWRNEKDEEYIIYLKMVAVQGSPCVPAQLILTLIICEIKRHSNVKQVTGGRKDSQNRVDFMNEEDKTEG
jgi:hypothetical protein